MKIFVKSFKVESVHDVEIKATKKHGELSDPVREIFSFGEKNKTYSRPIHFFSVA